MTLTRRAAIGGGSVAVALSALPFARDPASQAAVRSAMPIDMPARALHLFASERPRALLGPEKPVTQRCCVYNDEAAMVLRAPQGTRLAIDFENRLPDPTTVHWHGIRAPNQSDGVAPLTQQLVTPGQRFRYDVPLPDAGFYFFHPHCDETGQIGRGLFALLLVEDPRDPRFDLEHIIVVKDWRLDGDGQWLAMSTDEGAAEPAIPEPCVRPTAQQCRRASRHRPTAMSGCGRSWPTTPASSRLRLRHEGGVDSRLRRTAGHAIQPRSAARRGMAHGARDAARCACADARGGEGGCGTTTTAARSRSC